MSTYGASTAPSQNTINYDALLATSLFNYRGTLTDNISTSNPIFYRLKEVGMYQSRDGGIAIQEDLMFELGTFHSYDGYDELNTDPMDGITAAFFDWRQGSIPIAISEKERKQNKHRIANLLEAKIQQAEMGFIEAFNRLFLQGAGSGAINSAYVDGINGSSFIDPLFKTIAYVPSTGIVGNIDPSTTANSWWRNRTKTSAATTYAGFLQEVLNLWNTTSIGPGGPPDLIVCDQQTWEIWNSAYYSQYRRNAETDNDYPFPNFRWQGSTVTWDPYVPNIDAGTTDTTTSNGGTIAMLNSKFLKVVYEEETNFVETPFVKPVNQDARVAHILWMGNVVTNNRRKHGVMGHISRSIVS